MKRRTMHNTVPAVLRSARAAAESEGPPMMRTSIRMVVLLMGLGVTQISLAAEAAPAAKWHPGHYVTCWPGQPARSLEKHLDSPAIRGVKVVYPWRDLEVREGVYDFSRLEADLAVAKKHNKQLFLSLMEKSWGVGSNPPRAKLPAPDYLLDDAKYRGGVVPLAGARAQIAAIWRPAVMERLAVLVRELGRRFDGEPAFEGISTDETACDLGRQEEGFTPSSQLAAWKAYATVLREAFPHSTTLIYLNWFPRAEELAAHCAAIGVGFGGPDIVPIHSTRLNPSRYPPDKPRRKMTGDVAAEKYWGLVPIGHDAQTPVFGGKEGDPTLEEILDWAVTGLKCNYVFWPAITGDRYSYDLTRDVVPFLEKSQGRIVTTAPRS